MTIDAWFSEVAALSARIEAGKPVADSEFARLADEGEKLDINTEVLAVLKDD